LDPLDADIDFLGMADQRVVDIVREVLGRSYEPGERLDADSLSQAELVLALEDAFHMRLPDDTSLGTVDEAEAVIRSIDGRTGTSPNPLGDGIGRYQDSATRVLRPILRKAYHLAVRGAHLVPRSGPAVLASNHDSLLDIPALVVASPRPVWFMAKVELFRGPVASRFFHELGGFPVRRGGYDLRAIRGARAVLDHGRLLGMYPEGTRGRHLQGFLPGAAWLALGTGAPLVPVAVTGTAEALPRGSAVPRRSEVTVSFGEPLRPGKEEHPRARLARAREVTDDLRIEVEKLLVSTTG
jgi:1-acyl-sn-glycerol-3-phosphate acyltransferase